MSGQKKISFDVAMTRQMNHHMEGLNLSSFYFLNENLAGGFEVNRFFPVNKTLDEGGKINLSSWDLEVNFHYFFRLKKGLNIYPIVGISHTSEKEISEEIHETNYKKLFSTNTGAGIGIILGKWAPHIEYMFTWGEIKQQIFLAGISYEIEFGK